MSSNIICKYYLQGNCKYGSRCRFKHREPYQDNYYSYNDYSGGSYRGSDSNYRTNNYTYRENDAYYHGHDNKYRGSTGSYRGSDTYRENDNLYRGNDHLYRDNYNYRGNDHTYGANSSYRGNDHTYGVNSSYRGNDHTYGANNSSYRGSDAYGKKDTSYRGNASTYRGTDNSYRGKDHSYHGSDTSSNQSPNYNSNNQQNNTNDSIDILKAVQKEIEIFEQGKQWPLTCFVPVKEGSNAEGWIDHSPEEVRWKMYEARKDGTVEECKLKIQQLYKEAQDRRHEFSYREKALVLIKNILARKDHWANVRVSSFGNINLFHSENSSTPITDNSSVFSQNTGSDGNVFKQDTSVTGMDTASPLEVSNEKASSFGNTQHQADSVSLQVSSQPFHDPKPSFSFSLNQNNSNSNASVFATQVFNNIQTTNTVNNQFGVTQSEHFQSKQKIGETVNLKIFSCMSDLTESEIALFKARTFKFGEVPLIPPPKELCDDKLI